MIKRNNKIKYLESLQSKLRSEIEKEFPFIHYIDTEGNLCTSDISFTIEEIKELIEKFEKCDKKRYARAVGVLYILRKKIEKIRKDKRDKEYWLHRIKIKPNR